jgi:3-polyprenyl-4-hydroxybenzoate decarboxylase
MPNPLIVAIMGASGAIYWLRALELLRAAEVEAHLILTATARDILEHETGRMASAAEAGAIIFPPVPAFYGKPQTIDDVVTATMGRALRGSALRRQLISGGRASRRARCSERV